MKTTVKYLLLTLLFAALLPVNVLAKRVEPQPVKPIFWSVYKIQPSGNGGSGKITVSKRCKCYFKPKTITIYEINYLKSLEKDVQNLHITKLEFSNNLLLIKTENDGIFSSDIANGKVKMIKTPRGYRILKSDKTPVQLEKNTDNQKNKKSF